MVSMTGFGRGEAEKDGYNFVVDIKSVNGKFLDVSIKAPKTVLVVEDKLRKQISNKLNRGTVDVFVTITKQGLTCKNLVVDYLLAEQILKGAEGLSDRFNLPTTITSKDLLRFNGVLVEEEDKISTETLEAGLLEALEIALNELLKMRKIEGELLNADLKQKIDGISSCLTKVKNKAPEVVTEYYEKIKSRVQELLEGVEIDENRLASEVAFFADKADINEEIVRLESHIIQFNNLLGESIPVGKKFEFLSQEITREINTMGSKANNITLTNLVLEMKNLNESIKEQIRNVE